MPCIQVVGLTAVVLWEMRAGKSVGVRVKKGVPDDRLWALKSGENDFQNLE